MVFPAPVESGGAQLPKSISIPVKGATARGRRVTTMGTMKMMGREKKIKKKKEEENLWAGRMNRP
jgi:hypothetical protein